MPSSKDGGEVSNVTGGEPVQRLLVMPQDVRANLGADAAASAQVHHRLDELLGVVGEGASVPNVGQAGNVSQS